MNLADVYSYIDSKKRAVKGLLAEPGLTLQQYMSQISEDNDKRLNLQANAYPMAGGKTVLNSPHQLDQFRAQLANEASDMAMAGMFVGPSSKTWDKVSAQKATQMEKSGADARKIWSDTGTWKGPDGKWRQEIDDSLSSLKKQTPTIADYMSDIGPSTYPSKVSNLLNHGKLGAGYPDMMDMPLTMKNSMTGGSFEIDKFGPSIHVGAKHKAGDFANPTNVKSTTHHELQHAIQQREGWAQGGSPDSAFIERKLSDLTPLVDPQSIYKSGAKTTTKGPIMVTKDDGKFVVTDGNHRYADALKRGDATIKTHFDPSFFDGYGGNMDQAVKDAAFENYRRLAGEAEARATQARIPLDAAQRRATFPADSYDTPLDQLIMRFQSQ